MGLPDDYRRFLIHGQKLLQHLQRFDKKSPQLLGAAKEEVLSRLVKIQGQIDQLSHDIQTSIIDGLGTMPPASIFERSSTMSETDSAQTVSAHESQTSWGQFTGSGDDFEPLQSPSAYDAVLATPPRWPWNPPYPNRVLMPPIPDIDDGEGTVVPPVANTPAMSAVDAAPVSEIPESPISVNPLSGSLVLDPYEDWQEVIPHHRVIKRNEIKRYHDRAGAWRDRTVGDPRVGLSLEVASGSVHARGRGSRSPSRHRVTAQSDAEMELNKIRQAAVAQTPTVPHGASNVMGSPGESSQPLPIPSKNTDLSPSTELGASPTESLSGLARLISSPTSWKNAMIKIKNNLVTSPKSAEQRSPILPPSNLRQSQVPPEDDILVPPGPIFRGSRSANSSPGSNASPFPPPTLSAAEPVSPDEYLQAGLPVVVRRWETEEPPLPARFGESPEQTWSGDPMSLSYPAPTRGREPFVPGGMAVRGRGAQPGYHPPLTGSNMWTPAPSGYTSQPMSRDPSHQSLGSSSQGQPASPSPTGSAPTRPRISATGTGTSHHPPSSPLAMNNGTPDGLGLSPIPIGGGARLQPFPRNRRPSYTETEPSPRLDAAFPDVDTSYQRWEQLHNVPSRKNTNISTSSRAVPADDRLGQSFPPLQTTAEGNGSSSSVPNTPPLLSTPTGTATAARWQRLNRGRGRAHRGSGSGRSQSLSPSPSSSSRLHTQLQHPLAATSFAPQPQSPQLLPAAQTQSQPNSPQLLPPKSSQSMSPDLRGIGSFTVPNTSGGEPMARTTSGGSGSGSGSGSSVTDKRPSQAAMTGATAAVAGIRLGDGRMVEFGAPTGGGRRGSMPSVSSPLSFTGGPPAATGAASPSASAGSASPKGQAFGLGISQ